MSVAGSNGHITQRGETSRYAPTIKVVLLKKEHLQKDIERLKKKKEEHEKKEAELEEIRKLRRERDALKREVEPTFMDKLKKKFEKY